MDAAAQQRLLAKLQAMKDDAWTSALTRAMTYPQMRSVEQLLEPAAPLVVCDFDGTATGLMQVVAAINGSIDLHALFGRVAPALVLTKCTERFGDLMLGQAAAVVLVHGWRPLVRANNTRRTGGTGTGDPEARAHPPPRGAVLDPAAL
jgi:hypothetical protein